MDVFLNFLAIAHPTLIDLLFGITFLGLGLLLRNAAGSPAGLRIALLIVKMIVFYINRHPEILKRRVKQQVGCLGSGLVKNPINPLTKKG